MIDQTRKDGFRFRNVDETSHSANAKRSSDEDSRVNNFAEIREKETFEDAEKDNFPALVLDG